MGVSRRPVVLENVQTRIARVVAPEKRDRTARSVSHDVVTERAHDSVTVGSHARHGRRRTSGADGIAGEDRILYFDGAGVVAGAAPEAAAVGLALLMVIGDRGVVDLDRSRVVNPSAGIG